MLKWLRGLAFISLGCAIGVYFCNYEYFFLDPTIEISDIFNLVITSIVGLYIAHNIQKQQNSDRKEKDFIIEEIQDLRKDFTLFSGFNEAGIFPFEQTKSLSKSINRKLTQLERLIEVSSYCRGTKVDELQQNFRAIRNLVLQVSPVNDQIKLTIRQKNNLETKVSDLIQGIYKLILQVNKN